MKNVLFAVACLVLAQAVMSKPASADPVGGPTCHTDRVDAGSTDQYTTKFLGGQSAAVTVSGDYDTDLDLYVYDENGNLIGSDEDNTDQCVVRFQPKWTGPFTVRIVNRGRVYNQYTVCVR